MAEEIFDEKTEPATPRKRQEARERGQVARSQDLSSAVILLAAILSFEFFGSAYVGGLVAGAVDLLENLAHIDGDRQDLAATYGRAGVAALMGMIPFLILVLIAAVAVNLFQVGFTLSGESLVPKFEKMNPIEGMKRFFSMRSFMRLLLGLLKLTAVGVVIFLTIWMERERLLSLIGVEFNEIVVYGVDLTLTVSLRAVLVLLILAILEYGYQKWQYEQDLRMSKREVKEEFKRLEGDPKIKERRRTVQRQLAMARMMQQMPKATVVITNPTHVAVALEYRPKEMEAPVVIAKGAELLARRIREAALEHGVPIVERAELARALYKSADVGQSVPYDLYQAVAEVLAFVYRLKGLAAVA